MALLSTTKNWLRCGPRCKLRVQGRQLVAFVLVASLSLALIVLGDIRVSEAILTRKLLDGGVLRLVKMLTTSQNFDLPSDVVYQSCDLPPYVLESYQVRLAAFRRRREPIESAIKQEFAKLDADSQRRMKPYLPHATIQEHAVHELTVEELFKACKKAGLVAMAAKGTLLGAYRHHGLIPWDSDVDVFINTTQWRLALKTLSSVPGFALRATRTWLWKFHAHGNWTGSLGYPPYVDISFFAEDATHLWSHTWLTLGFLMSPKSQVFPLQNWPFGSLQIPVPCNLERAVTRAYNVDACQRNFGPASYADKDLSSPKSQHSAFLAKALPFVTRNSLPGGLFQQEVLRVGDTVIHNVTLPTSVQSCGSHAT